MLLKNHTNYIEDSIFKFSLKEYNRLFFKKKKKQTNKTKQNIFCKMYNYGKFKFWKRKNKDIRNRFKLKKELN